MGGLNTDRRSRLPELDAVAAGFFGLVHGLVGADQERFEGGIRGGVEGSQPDADRDREPAVSGGLIYVHSGAQGRAGMAAIVGAMLHN